MRNVVMPPLERAGRRIRIAMEIFFGILSAPGGMGRLIP